MPETPPMGISKVISEENYRPGDIVVEKETGKVRVKLVFRSG